MYQEVYKNEFKGLYYKKQSLEYYIDEMDFNDISTALALSLLAGITLLLLILAYFMLYCSIKRNLSKTKYYLNQHVDGNLITVTENYNNNTINNLKV